jgi:hypothetical protein
VQHLAARRQHSYTRTLGKQGRRDSRHLLESMLARVQHEDRVGIPKPGDHPREGVRAASVERLGDQPDDSRRSTGVGELDQPRPG